MITNPTRKKARGFTLIELTVLIMLAVAISAMGVDLINRQSYVYTKLYQLDSAERTAHNINNLCLGMIDNWSCSEETLGGQPGIVFRSRDKSHSRLVTLEQVSVDRGGNVGTAFQLVSRVYNTTTSSSPIASYMLTDPLIKSLNIESDITTLRITITDVWDGTAICHAARN